MKHIKLGVIGVGKMGKFHLNVINQIENIKLTGIYDIDKTSVKAFADEYNIHVFDSLDNIIKSSEAVIIATPTVTHFEIVKKAIKMNCHVLVEKPMTETYIQAQEIAHLVSKHNIVFQVGHVERFNGAVQTLKSILEKPSLIEARRLSPFVSRISDVGVVFDIMIHDLDIVMALVNKPLLRFSAYGKNIITSHEDVATAILEFEGNTIASISSSRVTEEKIRTLSISDKNAYFLLDYANQNITIHKQAKSDSNVKINDGGINYKQGSVVEHVFIHRDNPLKLEVAHFIKCILKLESPIVTIENDLKTLDITEKIYNKIKETF